MDRIKLTDYMLSEEYLKANAEMSARAQKIHSDVNQDYDGKPYIYHLLMVKDFTVKYLADVCDREEDVIPIVFGALFHDSIEDARLTYNDVRNIAKEYMSDSQSYRAAEIVYALTNEKGRNRHERANDKYYEGIRESLYAPLVKAADRLANYTYAKSIHSRMEECYKREMPEFIEKAVMKGGKPLVPQEMIDELLK